MHPEIDLKAFAAAHADNAFVIDVREPREYLEGYVPGACRVPLAQVLARRSELPKDEPVYVICASGNRSKSATDWLRSTGVEVLSVAGGTSAWDSRRPPRQARSPRQQRRGLTRVNPHLPYTTATSCGSAPV